MIRIKETDRTKMLEGIEVSTDNAVENFRFIRKSKELEKTHDWLYHCTMFQNIKINIMFAVSLTIHRHQMSIGKSMEMNLMACWYWLNESWWK